VHAHASHILVILAQGLERAVQWAHAGWGKSYRWSQLCLGREQADHARGSHIETHEPAAPSLSRAFSHHPTRESTLLLQGRHPPGCSSASLAQLEGARSRAAHQVKEKGGACPATVLRKTRERPWTSATDVQRSAPRARACTEHAVALTYAMMCGTPESAAPLPCCLFAVDAACQSQIALNAAEACLRRPCFAAAHGVGCLLPESCQLVTVRTMLPLTIRSETSTFHAPSRAALQSRTEAHSSNGTASRGSHAPPAAAAGVVSVPHDAAT